MIKILLIFAIALLFVPLIMLGSVQAGSVDVQISSSSDDAYQDPDSWPNYSHSDSSSGIFSGNPGMSGQANVSGFRWNINIPANSVITEAWVDFNQKGWGYQIPTTLAFERTLSPVTFSSSYGPYPRWTSKTVWTTIWTWGKSTPGTWVRSPSLINGIQELVSLGNVTSIVLLENGSGLSNGQYHNWEGYEPNPLLSAKLHVVWSEGSTLQSTPTAVPTSTSVSSPTSTPVSTPTPLPTQVPPSPVTISVVGNFDEPNRRYSDVYGYGNYAFIGGIYNGGGVDIVDLSNPSQPTKISNWGSSGDSWEQDVYHGYMYAGAERCQGVKVIDVRVPFQPIEISTIGIVQGGYDCYHNAHVSGNYLYIFDNRTSIVKIFYIGNPSTPLFVSQVSGVSGLKVHDGAIYGNRLYTAEVGGVVSIFDISVLPSSPILLGSFQNNSNAHSIEPFVGGKYIAVMRETSNGDVRIWDVQNPSNPVMVSVITPSSVGAGSFSAHEASYRNGLLYVSWLCAGLKVFDVAVPSNPVLVGQWNGSVQQPCTQPYDDGNWGIFTGLGTDRILVSDWDTGLWVLKIQR